MRGDGPQREDAALERRLGEVEALVRRALYSPGRQPADVDDLVQLTLERVIEASPRLADEVVAPYALVVARNLVISQARRDAVRRRRFSAPPAPAAPPGPEDGALAAEQWRALEDALSRLPAPERRELVAYQLTEDYEQRGGESPGAVRARMARLRAKARLEYVLAYRRVELPTPACRRVLLAISAGDKRQQRQVDAAAHLAECETCESLLAPLEARSSALAAFGLPLALLVSLSRKLKPRHLAASGATAAAAAAAAVIAITAAHGPSARHVARSRTHEPPTTTTAPTTTAPTTTSLATRARQEVVVPGVFLDGRPLALASLPHDVGSAVVGHMAAVEKDVSHNGFWLGTSAQDQVWAEFVGPPRSLHVQAGDHVSFRGRVAQGRPPGAGTALLNSGAANARDVYIAVSTQGFVVQPGP